MDTQPALTIHALTKSYGSVHALRGVDLEVGCGEIFGFLGPNGAGKTTTIRCLLDLIRPDGGTARVLGLDPQADPVAVRARVGYLPGELSIEPNQTAERALRYFAELRGGVEWAFVRELAGRLQLDLRAAVKNMSKGNKQKVGVVQALMARPELLLLDEPTAGLDPKQIIEARQLITDLGGNHTVVLSTHILPEVSQTCHRVVIIARGKVVAVDTPDNLTARLRGSETMYLQVAAPGADVTPALSAIAGITRVKAEVGENGLTSIEVDSEQGHDVRRELAATVVQHGWGLLELRPMRMSLEDIFLSLTTEDAGTPPADAAPAATEATNA